MRLHHFDIQLFIIESSHGEMFLSIHFIFDQSVITFDKRCKSSEIVDIRHEVPEIELLLLYVCTYKMKNWLIIIEKYNFAH